MGSKFRSNYRFIENLIDEFNKKAGLKISKNAILNKLNAGAIYVDGIEPNEPKVKDDEYKYKYARYENLCISSYQTSFRELYENYVQRMDKKIRSGKEPINEETKERNNKDLKEVTGLFFSILYTTYLKHFNDEGMLKAAKAQAHNITVDSYGKYNQFDGEQFSLANNNLYRNDKERIKASNDMINLFSNYVDYKAEKINSGQWHANSLKQSLDNTAIDPNATREDIQKYILNYRALEEKHKNRSFFSRLWHSNEQRSIDRAKANLVNIMGNTGNANIHGNPEEVFEHWMARQLDRSLALNAIHGAMIDETKINDYEQKIANNDKIEKAMDKANDKTAQRRKDIGVKQDKKEKQQQLIEFARKAYQAAENKDPDETEMNKLKGFTKTIQYVDYIKEHGFKLVKDENNKTSLHIDGEKLIEYRNKQKIGDRQQFIPNEKDINNSFFDNDIKKEDVIDTTIVDKNKNKEEIIDVPEV